MAKYRTREEYVFGFLGELRRQGRYVGYAYARGEPGWTGKCTPDGCPIMGRGPREGVFLAWEGDDGELKIGWSVRHPTLEPRPFCRAKGLLIAILRGSEIGPEDWPRMPDRHKEAYEQFIKDSIRQIQMWNNKRLSKAV